jgi:hypothetical protein
MDEAVIQAQTLNYTFKWAVALPPEPEPIAEADDANDAGDTEIAATWATC